MKFCLYIFLVIFDLNWFRCDGESQERFKRNSSAVIELFIPPSNFDERNSTLFNEQIKTGLDPNRNLTGEYLISLKQKPTSFKNDGTLKTKAMDFISVDDHIAKYFNEISVSPQVLSTTQAPRNRVLSKWKFGYHAKLTDDLLEQLKNDPDVAMVEPNIQIKPLAIQNNPMWALDKFDRKMDSKFEHDPDWGAGVDIYILDSGIDPYTEFGYRLRGYVSFIPGEDFQDLMGHGTLVAACAAGTVYGTAKSANLYNIKVFSQDGTTSMNILIDAVDWVVSRHLFLLSNNPLARSVINMSLGGFGYSFALDLTIKSAHTLGVVVVVAAGNENVDACVTTPANIAEAITVGATDVTDIRSSFSNFGQCVDIFAPGGDLVFGTSLISGTSFSSPYVAGAAAAILSTEQLSSIQVAQRLNNIAISGIVGDTKGGKNSFLTLPVDQFKPVIKGDVQMQLRSLDSTSSLVLLKIMLVNTATCEITSLINSVDSSKRTFSGVRGQQNILASVKSFQGRLSSLQVSIKCESLIERTQTWNFGNFSLVSFTSKSVRLRFSQDLTEPTRCIISVKDSSGQLLYYANEIGTKTTSFIDLKPLRTSYYFQTMHATAECSLLRNKSLKTVVTAIWRSGNMKMKTLDGSLAQIEVRMDYSPIVNCQLSAVNQLGQSLIIKSPTRLGQTSPIMVEVEINSQVEEVEVSADCQSFGKIYRRWIVQQMKQVQVKTPQVNSLVVEITVAYDDYKKCKVLNLDGFKVEHLTRWVDYPARKVIQVSADSKKSFELNVKCDWNTSSILLKRSFEL